MARKAASKELTREEENQAIRDALLQAVREEKKTGGPFNLSGRGHEPRISLSVQMAAILRNVSLPATYISGYGANSYYPERVFTTAQRILRTRLGWCPIQVGSSSVWRVEKPVPRRKPREGAFEKRLGGRRSLVATLPDGSRAVLGVRSLQFRALPDDADAAIERRLRSEVEDVEKGFKLPISVKFAALVRSLEAPALPFHECFKKMSDDRYSPRRTRHEFDVRFLTRLYRFPGSYQGGTFSPSTMEWNFLDGGITFHHGYHSASWTVVRGLDALRLVCMFFGIKQHARLPDRGERKPLAVLLEEISRVPLQPADASGLRAWMPARAAAEAVP